MTEPHTRDPARAVRRAAVEALSHTVLGSPVTVGLHAITGGPNETERELALHATSLTEAFAALANMPYGQALTALCAAAKELSAARRLALSTWTIVCRRLGADSVATHVRFLGKKDEAVTAYAVAADVSYDQACYDLYVQHGVLCPKTCPPPPLPYHRRGVSVTVDPYSHGHPGAHGVTVDTERASRGSRNFSELETLMYLAVRLHPSVQPLPERAGPTPGLDNLVAREEAQRDAALTEHSIGATTAGDYNALIQRMLPYVGVEASAREMVDDAAAEYLAFRDAAMGEWYEVAGLEFTTHSVGIMSTSMYAIVAVANALSLSMAEALAFVRDLAAAEANRPGAAGRSGEGEGG